MKVSPINNDVEAEIGLQAIDGIITYEEPNADDHEPTQHYQEEPQNLKLYLKKKTLASRAEAILATLTYDNAKWAMRWFLESATFKINLTVSLLNHGYVKTHAATKHLLISTLTTSHVPL